jgi:hypothetical protein
LAGLPRAARRGAAVQPGSDRASVRNWRRMVACRNTSRSEGEQIVVFARWQKRTRRIALVAVSLVVLFLAGLPSNATASHEITATASCSVADDPTQPATHAIVTCGFTARTSERCRLWTLNAEAPGLTVQRWHPAGYFDFYSVSLQELIYKGPEPGEIHRRLLASCWIGTTAAHASTGGISPWAVVTVPARSSIPPPPVEPDRAEPQKYLSESQRQWLKRYADDARIASMWFGAAGAVMGVLALAPEPIVTKGTVALWAVTTAAINLTSAAMGRLADDPPDSRYTSLAVAPKLRIPKLRPAGRVTGSVARALRAYVSLEVRKSGLAVAILQSVERATGASLAGDQDWEVRQLVRARQHAQHLVESLRRSKGIRTRLARAWKRARLPNITLRTTRGRGFKRSLAAAYRRLAAVGYPQDLIDAAAHARTERTADQRLLSTLTSTARWRAEQNAVRALGPFAAGG